MARDGSLVHAGCTARTRDVIVLHVEKTAPMIKHHIDDCLGNPKICIFVPPTSWNPGVP